MDEDTVPPAAAQSIITASNLLNEPQQCHKAAAHFTQAFRLAPQLASAFAEEFAEAIVEKAKAGVTCHVLLDAFGSKRMRDDLRRKMEEAGAQVGKYLARRQVQMRHDTSTLEQLRRLAALGEAGRTSTNEGDMCVVS